MNLIVGVDTADAYKPAVQLLGRLRFEKPITTLAHFVHPMPGYFPMEAAESSGMMEDYTNAWDNLGRDALDNAKDEACMRDLHPKCVLRYGAPASGLTELADHMHADLVAIGAERGSLWATSFLGSVSRGLAIGCHSSILVAKGAVKEAAPLKVVLATDHSAQSRRWIDKFLTWHARGIAEMHVVTAYDISDREAEVLQANLPALGGMVDSWIEDHLQKLNEGLEEELTAAGYKTTSRVVAGKANDVIREAIQDTQSDLLLMGAHGHGFVERLLIGSCAMHQVVSEPYPVLVVRG